MSCIGRNNNSAFSLIELVTVVMIVGILSAIAFRGYAEHRSRARSAEMYSYITIMEKNQQLYHQEWGTFLFLKNCTSVTARAAMQSNSRFITDGGESVQMRLNWAQVGSIFPIGTSTYFYMVANMGKFFRNGTAAGWADTWSRGPVTQPLYRAYTEFDYRVDTSGESQGCSGSNSYVSFYPTDFGAVANPNRAYDWVLISTTARLGSVSSECVAISRLMTFDSLTGNYHKRGFIEVR